MTYSEIMAYGRRSLAQAGVADADTDARYLAEYVFAMDLAKLLMKAPEQVTDNEAISHYEELIGRRCEGEPLQYITGGAYFMGMEFEVDESVLIPRQDTETLCENAIFVLEKMDRPYVLDMCTGSGCIIISLARLCSLGRAEGADISRNALELAGRNVSRLSPGKVELILSDMFENIDGRYDMIVSNPPYIRSGDIAVLMREVRDHEPRTALDGGPDGLEYYRILADGAGDHLRPGGYLMAEIGYDQGSDVTEIFAARGFTEIKIVQDLAGNDRVVSARTE